MEDKSLERLYDYTKFHIGLYITLAIKVNAVNPGYTATDLNDNAGTQTLEEGAAETVRQALAAEDAPTGGFFETGAVVP